MATPEKTDRPHKVLRINRAEGFIVCYRCGRVAIRVSVTPRPMDTGKSSCPNEVAERRERVSRENTKAPLLSRNWTREMHDLYRDSAG